MTVDNDRTARSMRNVLHGLWGLSGIAVFVLAAAALGSDELSLWLVLALAAVLVALAGSVRAARGDHVRLALGVGSLPVLAGGALLGLAELFFSAWRCDESCDPSGGGSWRYDPHAWEWSLIGVCGVLGLVGLLVASGLVIARRPRAAVVAYGVAAIAYLVPLLMTYSGWVS